jgi:DUF4097 and DUF4098 domain-containing protein YvlB
MTASTLVAVLLAMTTGAVSARADCSHRAPRKWKSQAAGVERVRIVAKAGSLSVAGRADAAQIRVEGFACAGSERQLEAIEIRTERSGSELRIESIIPERWSLWGDSAQLDLEIEVPQGVVVDIEDSSGALEIFGVAALHLDDNSGAIEIGDIAGDVRIEDGSGGIKVAGVGGDLWVHDGSGGIDIEEVGGTVTIDQDGSGDINIEKVEGLVLVRRDGSGGIDVRGVTGDFTVEHDGTGGIHYADIGGRVEIPNR